MQNCDRSATHTNEQHTHTSAQRLARHTGPTYIMSRTHSYSRTVSLFVYARAYSNIRAADTVTISTAIARNSAVRSKVASFAFRTSFQVLRSSMICTLLALLSYIAKKMAGNQERTYIMIKPDGVQRGLVGEIIKRFEVKGFKLVALKLTWVSGTKSYTF